MSSKFTNLLKQVWGVGSTRGFKLAAWSLALVTFSVWQYVENRPVIVDNKVNKEKYDHINKDWK